MKKHGNSACKYYRSGVHNLVSGIIDLQIYLDLAFPTQTSSKNSQYSVAVALESMSETGRSDLDRSGTNTLTQFAPL